MIYILIKVYFTTTMAIKKLFFFQLLVSLESFPFQSIIYEPFLEFFQWIALIFFEKN